MAVSVSDAKRSRIESADVRHHLEPESFCTSLLMDAAEASSVTIPYDQADDGLLRLMEDKGVAIVTGVLDASDIAALEEVLRQDMEELIDSSALEKADATVQKAWSRVCCEGLQAWPASSLADVGARGRFQDRGMPHGRFAWNARMHSKVKHVYEILHSTSDLVASCDNAFVTNPSQAEVTTSTSWPHVDQNDHETRIPCRDWDVYQGLVYVWGSESSHASTTVVWPGSHKQAYADYMSSPTVGRRIADGKSHFTLISCMEPGSARDRLITGWAGEARRLPVPAGSLLLWTSRTTHQGWSGGPRLAQPVCWEPRSRRDEMARERKMRLAALGLPSTHWASLAQPHELSEMRPPAPVSAMGAEEHERIRFPLHSNIRSRALAAEAKTDELWRRLLTPEWFAPLPADVKSFLEESISDEYKAVL